VVANYLARSSIKEIEKRIKIAVVSPPRHVIVRSMVMNGRFEFDPFKYYPKHWSKSRMMHFTYHRLPLHQGVLCNPYQTVRLRWLDDRIHIDRVQRAEKYDPVIRTRKEARQALRVPSCF